MPFPLSTFLKAERGTCDSLGLRKEMRRGARVPPEGSIRGRAILVSLQRTNLHHSHEIRPQIGAILAVPVKLEVAVLPRREGLSGRGNGIDDRQSLAVLQHVEHVQINTPSGTAQPTGT